ncbi:MAG: hypothetical protein OEW52_11055 [Thermoleophilia bacterium]|nr:hypothetical protein [Thermoleophilia bacterium]MDH5281670.1 hypothetical protein [Thermoleophilia bacterium]
MSPKAIAVAGLSALALAASGCSGGSESEAEKFRASFEERYGSPENEATWYRHITGLRMGDDGYFKITTDLGPENEEGSVMSGTVICRAASTLALELGVLGDEIRGVNVKGRDGGGLVGCA